MDGDVELFDAQPVEYLQQQGLAATVSHSQDVDERGIEHLARVAQHGIFEVEVPYRLNTSVCVHFGNFDFRRGHQF